MKYFLRAVTFASFVAFIGLANAFSLPSQVENMQVFQAGTDSVRVSWSEAESAEDVIIGYRVYFGTTSVQDVGAAYDDEVVVSGGIETTIGNLLPGTEYFFAVTGLDSEENESENYSVEVAFVIPVVEVVEPEVVTEPVVTEPVVTEPVAEEVVEEIVPEVETIPDILVEPEVKEEVLPEKEEVKEEETFGTETPEEFKPAAPDVMPPLEAMNLSVDTSRIDSHSVAVLSWKKSLNLDNDMADQILFVREGMGDWDTGYSIGTSPNTIELDVQEGQSYEYKIVTVDSSENRSTSRVFAFTTKLAKSGPAGMLGGVIALFLFLVFGVSAIRRRA